MSRGTDRPDADAPDGGAVDARDRPRSTRGESDATGTTVCPLCAVGCHLTAGEGGRARGVEGPANPNARLCSKGVTAFEPVGDAARLTDPLVREGDDLVPTDWETALGRAVAGLAGVAERDGADALCFLGAPHCSNEENYLLQKLARALGTNNVDNRARICHECAADALTSRFGHPASTVALEDLAAADLVLVVGANPAVQQPVAFNEFVRPSEGTLVHVDPRANETTRAADVHLAPRPGTDAVLLQSVNAHLAESGGVDGSFVAERTAGFGSYADSLADIDAADAAAATGIPTREVRAFAEAVADAERVAVIAGTGVETDEGETASALLDLLCLTGNVGVPGGGFALFRGLNNEQGATDVGCRPDRLPGHAAVADSGARARLADVWGVEVPATVGRNEQELLADFGDGVRGALVVGENPAIAKRDADWTTARLDALDALVVLDVYETETTAHADVVLPAAVGLEKSGTVTNLDRRVQALTAVADPPGEARTDFETLCALGRRLVGDGFDFESPADAFAELRAVSPLHADLTVGDRWGGDRLYESSFETADGRARFAPVSLDVPAVPEGELALVVGSRAGGFGASDARADDAVHLSSDDAARLDLDDGDDARVLGAGASVETTVVVEDGLRTGVAYLHADAADPLVRAGARTVRIEAG